VDHKLVFRLYQKPYLEIHVRGGRQTPRSKRQLGDLDCDDLSLERRCCRYPLVVDFDSFGWDWVIVPRRYSAYYCSGECPFLYYQTQGHQHVRQQQAAEGSAATGGPCCSPKRVSAISMLYYDEHMNIVHGRLPGMVVEQCGCS
jgi:Transforming growth factor beta like domain